MQRHLSKRNLKRGHNDPKPVTAKCCRALLPSNKVDVNYIATSTCLRVHRSFFKAEDDKSIFSSYNRAMCARQHFGSSYSLSRLKYIWDIISNLHSRALIELLVIPCCLCLLPVPIV